MFTLSGSVTTTWNVQVFVLPWWSEAATVTVFVPTGKVEPDAGSDVTTGLASAASVAERLNVAVALVPLQTIVRFVGQSMLGAVVSLTVTVNVHVFVL